MRPAVREGRYVPFRAALLSPDARHACADADWRVYARGGGVQGTLFCSPLSRCVSAPLRPIPSSGCPSSGRREDPLLHPSWSMGWSLCCVCASLVSLLRMRSSQYAFSVEFVLYEDVFSKDLFVAHELLLHRRMQLCL